MAEMTSWLVPEVRVGDISLPMIRQCDDDDPGDDGSSCVQDVAKTMEKSVQQQLEPLELRPQQLTWCVMSDDDNDTDEQNENRGNLPREGALLLSGNSAVSAAAGLGSSLLAVPWQVPRRRHSWICRYLSTLSLSLYNHNSNSNSNKARSFYTRTVRPSLLFIYLIQCYPANYRYTGSAAAAAAFSGTEFMVFDFVARRFAFNHVAIAYYHTICIFIRAPSFFRIPLLLANTNLVGFVA